MVTVKQKPTVNTQKIKRKEANHTTTKNHQIAKKENKTHLSICYLQETCFIY